MVSFLMVFLLAAFVGLVPVVLAAALSFLVTMGLPREHFGDCLRWLGMATAFVGVVLANALTITPVAAKVMIVFVVLVAATISAGATVAVRLIVDAVGVWRRGRVGVSDRTVDGIGSLQVSRIQIACAGVLAAFLLDLLLRPQLHGLRPAWAAHLLIGAVIAMAWATFAIPRARWASFRHSKWCGYARSFTMAFCWSMLALLVAEASFALFVAHHAAAIAGEEPYCIQTAARDANYRPAETLLDLSPLTMHAKYRGGSWHTGIAMYGAYHAILVIGDGPAPRILHWSYRRGDFVEEIRNRDNPVYWPVLYCTPRRDFADRLPVLFGGSADATLVVRVGGRRLVIPTVYQPKVSGARDPYIIVAARAPDFRALDGPARRPGDPTWMDDLIWIHFAPRNRLTSYATPSANDQIEELGQEFGLAKRIRRWGGRSLETVEYYARDASGLFTTLLWCPPPSLAHLQCRHRFLHDGLLFEFSHRSDLLPEWARMQQRLVELLESWEAHGRMARPCAGG